MTSEPDLRPPVRDLLDAQDRGAVPGSRPPAGPSPLGLGPAGPGRGGADPWLETEQLVDRVARLALLAHALTERRRAAAPVGDASSLERGARQLRLDTAVRLSRQALRAFAEPGGGTRLGLR